MNRIHALVVASVLVSAVLGRPTSTTTLLEGVVKSRSSYSPPVPKISSTFVANVTEVNRGFTYHLKMSYDGVSQLSRTSGDLYDATLKGMYYIDNIANVTAEFENLNNVCRQLPGGRFRDLFSWLPAAKYVGQKQANGKLCDVWQYLGDAPCNNNGCAIGVYEGNIPVILEGDLGNLEFETFNPMTFFPPNTFTFPEACTQPAPLCPATTVQSMDIFVAHPANIYSLPNQDVADLLGDVAFICLGGGSGGPNGYSLVSHMVLELDPSFGSYILCNGEPGTCIGEEPFFVGREATAGVGADRGGQCSPNVGVGSWYSLPKGGECKEGESPTFHGSRVNQDGCTWKVTKRVKTIELSCLQQHGMADACRADQTIPFASATKAFKTALLLCPDVPPSLQTTI
eukprot:m.341542 g.341542  ORF g.341542 m.341542 type:complete len:399 (+) comp20180_c0_seq1:82-1278(+)